MGAQLGVPYGHMGCRQFGVQFGYLDVYDLPFCVPYDVVLLFNVPVVLFCVPYDVVLLLDVPMDLCTQLYSCTDRTGVVSDQNGSFRASSYCLIVLKNIHIDCIDAAFLQSVA